MAKNWRWPMLAVLTLAGCSSGAAASGPTATTAPAGGSVVVQPTQVPPDPPPTTTTSPTTTSVPPGPEVVEFVTPSGLTRLRVTYPLVSTSAERTILDAYVAFMRMSDSIGDTPDPSNPLINATTILGVREKTRDSAARLQRTGQLIRGISRHQIGVKQIFPDKVQITDCVIDDIGLYAWDGSAIILPDGGQYPVTAFLVQDEGAWKVRSYMAHEDQPCGS
jgi:hypothetical protein